MFPTYTTPKPTSPSFSRFHSSPTTMHPPKYSTSTLLSLSTQKLHHLSSLLSSSPRDSPDLLRKGVLIQNAMDWGVVERRREKEREREGMRKVQTQMQMQRGGGRRKSEGAVKMMVAVVEEAEEEEEEEAAEQQAMAQVELAATSITSSSAASTESSSEDGMVVDPSEYLFAHEEEVIIQAEQDEAEAAWFEEHWNDLQADSHAQPVKSTPAVTPFTGATTDVSVQVYSVESDSDSDDSLPTDLIISGRISPESLTSLTAQPQAMEISPPPSPKLSPTRLSDKLESPMEFGTMPARLESAISFEDFEAVWEVKGMDEAFVLPSAPVSVSGQEMVIYEGVPALGEDSETDEEEEEEEKDDELLVTPGEEALEEFGAASYESGSEMEEMRLIGVKGKN